MKTITARQQEILNFIETELGRRGIPPTVREIAARFNIASPNGVWCHLKALRDKGLIKSEPGVSRGTTPVAAATHDAHMPSPYPPPGYPVAGEVAAGAPRLAVQSEGDVLTLDEAAGARPGDFLLRVKGESMTGAGINPGDYVVVRPGQDVQNGGIAVVMVGLDEATVKRYYRGDDGMIRLVPENPDMAEIVVDPAEVAVSVVGRVCGVVRRY